MSVLQPVYDPRAAALSIAVATTDPFVTLDMPKSVTSADRVLSMC
mgnify:CR=1 FL=1